VASVGASGKVAGRGTRSGIDSPELEPRGHLGRVWSDLEYPYSPL
jgi:hypothetical protein